MDLELARTIFVMPSLESYIPEGASYHCNRPSQTTSAIRRAPVAFGSSECADQSN